MSLYFFWLVLPLLLTICLPQLSPVDQASVGKISEFIDRCETIFRDERQAWVSLNIEMKNKQITKKVELPGEHQSEP